MARPRGARRERRRGRGRGKRKRCPALPCGGRGPGGCAGPSERRPPRPGRHGPLRAAPELGRAQGPGRARSSDRRRYRRDGAGPGRALLWRPRGSPGSCLPKHPFAFRLKGFGAFNLQKLQGDSCFIAMMPCNSVMRS